MLILISLWLSNTNNTRLYVSKFTQIKLMQFSKAFLVKTSGCLNMFIVYHIRRQVDDLSQCPGGPAWVARGSQGTMYDNRRLVYTRRAELLLLL